MKVRSTLTVLLVLCCSACDDPKTLLTDEDIAAALGQKAPDPLINLGGVIPLEKPIIVDKAKALEADPALKELPLPKQIEAEQKKSPWTAMSQIYVEYRSRPKMLNFQHQVRIMRELYDGQGPPLEEFLKLADQCDIEFQKLPTYQVYGYDRKLSDLCILEDRAEKEKVFKENNLAWPPANEFYGAGGLQANPNNNNNDDEPAPE